MTAGHASTRSVPRIISRRYAGKVSVKWDNQGFYWPKGDQSCLSWRSSPLLSPRRPSF